MAAAGGKTITGRVESGLGEGAAFTRLEWARRQFGDKLGVDPFPGTLNLTIEGAARTEWARLRPELPVLISPPDAKFCDARAGRVRIAGRIAGAVVVPLVPGYPDNKIEVIAAVRVREALGLADGDAVTLEFLP